MRHSRSPSVQKRLNAQQHICYPPATIYTNARVHYDREILVSMRYIHKGSPSPDEDSANPNRSRVIFLSLNYEGGKIMQTGTPIICRKDPQLLLPTSIAALTAQRHQLWRPCLSAEIIGKEAPL